MYNKVKRNTKSNQCDREIRTEHDSEMEGVVKDARKPFVIAEDDPQIQVRAAASAKERRNTVIRKIKSKSHGTTTRKLSSNLLVILVFIYPLFH